MPITDVLGEGGLLPGGSATVEVAHGGGQVNSDVVVEWDLDNDGDFSEAVEDITPYVLAAETLAGRDWPSQLTGKASAGKLKATLDNSTDRFSKRNLDSPLTADPFSLKLGRKLRIRARVARCLRLPGTGTSRASTPDNAALDITGDLDIRIDAAADNWRPGGGGAGVQTLIAKFVQAGSQNAYMVQLTDTGFVRLVHSTTGADVITTTSTAPITAGPRTRRAIKVEIDVNNGAAGFTVTYSTARTIVGPWTQLGDPVVTGGVTSIFNSSAALEIGSFNAGATERFTGEVYGAEVRAGLASTDVRANPNFEVLAAGATSFTDAAGRVWTVHASGSVIEDPNVNDPVLLARDRFNRSAGSTVELGAAETGQTWEHGLAGTGPYRFIIFDNEARIAFADVGFNVPDLVDLAPHRDCYVQARIGQPVGSGSAGVIARYVDPNNYLRVEFSFSQVTLIARVAGVDTGLGAFYEIDWPAEGFIVGLHVEQSTARLYINGVTGGDGAGYDLAPFTIPTGLMTGTKAGIYGYWPDGDLEAVTVDDFHVWDRPTTELPGVLWTGDLVNLQPSVDASGAKIVQLEGDGQLARAAMPDVRAPVLPKEGEFTGVLTGEVLHKAQLLHPPGLLDLGTVRTGPVALGDGKALGMIREFEDTEIGLLYETPEGPLGYQDRSARIGAAVQAEFSDADGAQFSYSTLDLQDSRQEIINLAQAGVAAAAPGGNVSSDVQLTVRTNNAGAGVASPVNVLLPPAIEAGDFLVIFISSSGAIAGRGWKTPIWWTRHREFGVDDDDSIGMRVYSHFCDGTEDGTTVSFYRNDASGGAWIAHVWHIKGPEGWYESYTNGVAMADVTNGSNPTPFDHGWGRYPTAFFVARAGITSVSGGDVDVTNIQNFPDGWNENGTVTQLNGTVNGFDAALATSYRFDAQDKIDPGAFKGFQGFAINECVIFAVRGYNGPHTKATLKNPQTTGGDGRVVTVEDDDSQTEHNIIRSAPSVPALFRNEDEAEAYCHAVLGMYADDRPLPRISYVANRSAAYRAQAHRRRVGDRIHFVADNRTGMGIDSDHFIETIGHRFTHGTKLWEVTYDLSPG